ncbi:uncharacterized protein LOC120764996 [Hirundo rustica]|uniref:uncharacterized protein LOC120764996 n=1 Tax=Hirundo rustica TaxID=43150 RepID=UPI002673D8D4|nr:uncharacterized protein LOC120764996 [Hirundo rustica]
MVRDDEAAEDQDMSITDDDIIRITASEGIPVRKAKALEFSRQASSFLLSKDFMRQFFQQFSEAASEFQHDPMSSFSRIFLPRKGAAEKSGDAQQSLVLVLQEKEKETKQDAVKPQKQVDPAKDKAAAKLQTQQPILVSDKTQVPGAREFLATDWTEIRKHALKGETLQMGSRSMAMPVTYDAQDANPRRERLDREVVKDLMKAVRDNGLGSLYFKQLLEGTFNIYDLTPFDLKSLASMILTDSQFIIWEAKWRKALNELRDKYQGGVNAGLTVAQLAGDPPLDSPARQARLFPREVLTDIKNAARKATVQIPLTGVTESSYTDIKQGPSESFTSFVDHLTQAVDRQVSDEGVKPHLIRCLTFANANPECKRVISAMPGQPSMAEILEACSRVGTPQHVATILGDQVEKAVKDAFANFQQRQCYKCGKEGRFKKDCPELAEIASSLDVCPSGQTEVAGGEARETVPSPDASRRGPQDRRKRSGHADVNQCQDSRHPFVLCAKETLGLEFSSGLGWCCIFRDSHGKKAIEHERTILVPHSLLGCLEQCGSFARGSTKRECFGNSSQCIRFGYHLPNTLKARETLLNMFSGVASEQMANSKKHPSSDFKVHCKSSGPIGCLDEIPSCGSF